MLRGVNGSGGGAPIGGTGTGGKLALWAGVGASSTLTDSLLTQSGSTIYGATVTAFGFGTATPTANTFDFGASRYALWDDSQTKIGDDGIIRGLAATGDSGISYFGTKSLIIRRGTTESARIDSLGRFGIGQTPTTYILETATDASFYGVVVGRGAGGVSTNTAVGSNALAGNTTGSTSTAVGAYAGYRHTVNTAVAYVGYAAGRYQTGGLNTAVGYQAMLGVDGSSNGALNTAVGSESLTALTSGANNTALGRQSGLVLTSGGSNVLLGVGAGNTITTGSQNICIGVNATTAAAADSNQLVIGASGNYVATNGGATTWYTTATAQSTGVLPATCGFIRVRLNGTYVKIPVYAD